MNLRNLNDAELLSEIKKYVQSERDLLVKVLHHLREIERRRLFCDLGYKRLFDYALGELHYSDGQKELLKLQPQLAVPKERERQVTETSSEVRFVMSNKLKAKLEEVRSLLGTKGAAMSYAELFEAMSDLSIELLKSKKFGKKRTQKVKEENVDASVAVPKKETPPPAVTVSPEKQTDQKDPRYISQALEHFVWERDQGRCVNCGSTRNLNYDHIKPVSLGGLATAENIRLLCFHCKQRASTKIFGEFVPPRKDRTDYARKM